MRDPLAPDRTRITGEDVEIAIRDPAGARISIRAEPVLVVAVENGPEGSAGNVCEPPLHEGERNISQHPHVVSDVARGCRRDGSEPSWFLRGERPLILAAVRSAPRDHLAVAERLPRP